MSRERCARFPYSAKLLINAINDDTDLKRWVSRGAYRNASYFDQKGSALASRGIVVPIAGSQTPPFSLDDVRHFVIRNSAMLRKAGLEDFAVSLESLDIEALYEDLEQLEKRFVLIEEEMIARLRADASDEALFEARQALDTELKPYRGKMSGEQLKMLEKQFLDRWLLEASGLPRLSLFYL